MLFKTKIPYTYFLGLFIVFTIISCNDDDSHSKSNKNEIISFIFETTNNPGLNQNIIGVINDDNQTVKITVPFKTDVSNLKPTIEVSPGAKIRLNGSHDFSGPVYYTIMAENGAETSYKVTVYILPNHEKKILEFKFLESVNESLKENITGLIDEHTQKIIVEFPHDTKINSLLPFLKISENAIVTPQGSQDFTKTITYTVKAEDNTISNYKVFAVIKENLQKKALVAIYNSNPGLLEWDLNEEDLSKWKGVILDNNQNVIELHLSNYRINIIPPEIKFLKELNILVLDDNNLLTLPSQIEYLQKLTKLSIRHNKLNVLPKQMGELVNLVSLSLGYNKLIEVPSEIQKLINLQRLDLSNNILVNIPSEIGGLQNLRELFLFENKLAFVPAEISLLKQLEYLFLGNNNLKEIPLQIGELHHLKELYLNNNELLSIPSQTGNIKNLQYLHLGNNKLSTIPPEIGNLSYLEFLHLDHNELVSLPVELSNLTNLFKLFIQHNNLEYIPNEICIMDIFIDKDPEITCK
ncbi:leucine-rich repeat domain-containing protein [Abyssalbus ytuae]|uniref:Uncharacterized protein n=1 Tax=Abyssalbus ytuae TaxID=2926907 RepID=A0A9E6ZP47_9FLAO|nr:leucine-rich repeat domain-containing protein [Abyssalbus ytuae]UOB16143.1 hypothetical protein MQE35_10380 [Abyssalbus ytuae]